MMPSHAICNATPRSSAFLPFEGVSGAGGADIRDTIGPESTIGAYQAQKQSQNPAKINTIQFLNEDPLATVGRRGTLRRIAEETGGTHKFISERDLNLR